MITQQSDLNKFYTPEFEELLTETIDRCNGSLETNISKAGLTLAYHVASSAESTALLKHHIAGVCELTEYLGSLKTGRGFDVTKAPPIVHFALLEAIRSQGEKALDAYNKLREKNAGIRGKIVAATEQLQAPEQEKGKPQAEHKKTCPERS